jgi:hypothetical protein
MNDKTIWAMTLGGLRRKLRAMAYKNSVLIMEHYENPWWCILKKYGARVVFMPKRLGLVIGPVSDLMAFSNLEVDMHILKDNQKLKLEVNPVSAKGNPTLVQGVSWKASPEGLLEVKASEDGMSVELKAKGPLGVAQVVVTADADLGGGYEELIGILDIEIKAGKAAKLDISVGPAEDVVEVAPAPEPTPEPAPVPEEPTTPDPVA